MRFFKRGNLAEDMIQLGDDLGDVLSAFAVDPEPTILNKSACVVSAFLDDARSRRAALLNQRAEIDEELRQTEIAIAAFEPVLIKLDDGYDPADDAKKSYEVAIAAKKAKRSGKPTLIAAE